MAERKAVNKYYPPDWNPSKGGLNKYHGTHHLRERARKIDQGILIVRFEMPFNIWCLSCNSHIGVGVRYNAEKKAIGKYYSTTIYSFRMKCHLCSGWIEIHTDPKNSEYLVVEGARRKEESFQAADNETIELVDPEKAKEMADNAFLKLEHDIADREKAAQALPQLQQLVRLSNERWKDDYASSQKVRRLFRTEKKFVKRVEESEKAYREKTGIGVKLLKSSESDLKRSARIAQLRKDLRIEPGPSGKIRRDLVSASIFNQPSESSEKKAPIKKEVISGVKDLSVVTAASSKDYSSTNLSIRKLFDFKQSTPLLTRSKQHLSSEMVMAPLLKQVVKGTAANSDTRKKPKLVNYSKPSSLVDYSEDDDEEVE